MSRLGKRPINVPDNVKVGFDSSSCIVTVEGPKGKLAHMLHPDMKVEISGNQIFVKRPSESDMHKALHGLSRKLILNMITGVTTGWQKILELEGVGYRAQTEGNKLSLQIGFTHPVDIVLPQGIKADVAKQTIITISGIDKQLVGQVSADIRAKRPPEPYKGKGIRYQGEYIRRKVGKAVAAATTGGK